VMFRIVLFLLSFFLVTCGRNDSNFTTDTASPTITIIGENPLSIILGDDFVDPGAIATDEQGNSLEVTTNGTVDSSTIGSYKLIYSATDVSNKTSQGIRIVNVIFDDVAAKPFPQERNYVSLNKPNHKSQSQLNEQVITHFEDWKNAYLTQSNGNTPGGGYYIKMGGEGCTPNASTSEAHGYGMIIMALMAGQESQAKFYFDGMYNMYDQHRSIINKHLMSWCLNPSEESSYNDDSATDGDMDIAYSLILAHEQWGSDGPINYLIEAKRIITEGIKVSNMGANNLILLGDWVPGNSNYVYATRSSDWMTSHLRVFAIATGDNYWNKTADNVYQLMDDIRTNYAQTTGLMPDFVNGEIPSPAPANFLEAVSDGQFSWNACRVPLRIAFDAAHFNNNKAQDALSHIVDWIELKTAGEPSAIVAGYDLDGNALVSYSSMAFTAPMIAAATVARGDHQDFINKGWDLIINSNNNSPNRYYPNSIKLLSMLFISGNWWQPLQ